MIVALPGLFSYFFSTKKVIKFIRHLRCTYYFALDLKLVTIDWVNKTMFGISSLFSR